jgi:hypothetical protein
MTPRTKPATAPYSNTATELVRTPFARPPHSLHS